MGLESNALHPSGGFGQLYPQSPSQPAHGSGGQQHIPSLIVDRGPLAVTDTGPLGRYPSNNLLAECSSKEPGNAGGGEPLSFSQVRLSADAEPFARNNEDGSVRSPVPGSLQEKRRVVGSEEPTTSPTPQGSGTSFFERAHNLTVGALNTTSIGRDQVNYTTNVYQGETAPANLDELRGEIREWLKAPSYHEIHTTAIDQRTDNTGMWFLNSNQFQQLKKGGGCVLWCTGMPGSGKTILASISIEHLEDSFKSETNVAVMYAYLRYSEKHSLHDVFAALLDQLLEHDVVVAKIEPSFSEKSRKSATCTSEKVIWHILKDAIESLFKVFAVIDGLDEADDKVKDGLLEALPSAGTNVLILSRPLEPFTHHTPNALRVSIQARTEDIALYINEQFRKNSRLRALLGGRSELATELSTQIKEQANGMFLLARPQLETIMRTSRSVKSLFEALENLPSGIDEMYNLTLQRINDQVEEDRLAVHRLFTWLLYQKGDSELNIQDLQYALGVSIDSQTFDERAIISEDLLLSACHGLVVVSPHPYVDRLGPVFRFIHYSTQEFLNEVMFSTIHHPQAFLAATCLVFVAQHADVIQSGVPEGRPFPFLDYACTKWGEHAESSEHLGEPLHPSIVPSLLKCPVFPFSVESVTPTLHRLGSQRTGFGSETVMLPSLTVASMYGLVDVVKSGSLPFSRTSTTFPDGYRSSAGAVATPFHSATSSGHFNTFIALLSTYGTQGIPLWTSKEPLLPPIPHLAVLSPPSGTPFLQRLSDLIDSPPSEKIRLALSELDINLQDAEGNTALVLACKNADEDVVRFLISRQGVEVRLRNTHGCDAFHFSVMHPESGVALLLLTQSPTLDVETADQGGVTAFMTACSHGHQHVIDYVRSKRPNEWARLIHRTDLRGTTALMRCSIFLSNRGPEKEAILRTLIENGSDLQARETEDGMTTFAYAIRYRDSDARTLITHILNPLLEYDPSAFDQRNDRGQTPLMLELLTFHPDETLLKFLTSSSPIPKQYCLFNTMTPHDFMSEMETLSVSGSRLHTRSCTDNKGAFTQRATFKTLWNLDSASP